MPELDLTIEGGVALITIDRPEARNALGLQTMADLGTAIRDVARSAARVLVITGAGERSFVAGGDLKELVTIRDRESATAFATSMRHNLDALATLPIPVLAALNGDAIGGGAELAVTADFRIAAEGARIGFPQAQLALVPAWGGLERLNALVGSARASYLLATGAMLDARAAEAWGLVEEVIPRDAFLARRDGLAASMAALPGEALRGIKRRMLGIRPATRPDLESEAVGLFADSWLSPAHWEAAEARERQRRERRRD